MFALVLKVRFLVTSYAIWATSYAIVATVCQLYQNTNDEIPKKLSYCKQRRQIIFAPKSPKKCI